ANLGVDHALAFGHRPRQRVPSMRNVAENRLKTLPRGSVLRPSRARGEKRPADGQNDENCRQKKAVVKAKISRSFSRHGFAKRPASLILPLPAKTLKMKMLQGK